MKNTYEIKYMLNGKGPYVATEDGYNEREAQKVLEKRVGQRGLSFVSTEKFEVIK